MPKIVLPIVATVIVLGVAFAILYNFNLSFQSKVLTIYYKFVSEESSLSSKVVSCDSNNKTDDYFTKGTALATYANGVTDIYADACDGSIIKEYFCEFNKIDFKEYECEAGCYDGACVFPSEEISVMDENLSAFCKDYRITSPLNAIAQNEFSFYSSLNAIDGDLSTHWFGDPAHPYPKWIYFDFGEKVCISDIDLYAFSQDIPIQGNIQASQDSVRWKTILSNITILNLSSTISLPEIVTARYIRWFETSSNRQYGELTDARFRISDLPEDKR